MKKTNNIKSEETMELLMKQSENVILIHWQAVWTGMDSRNKLILHAQQPLIMLHSEKYI